MTLEELRAAPEPAKGGLSLEELRAAPEPSAPAARGMSLEELRAAPEPEPAKVAASSFVRDFDVDVGGADSFSTQQKAPFPAPVGPPATIPTNPERDLWNEKQHGLAANLLVGYGDTMIGGAKAAYHGVRDPLRAYSDKLFERDKWRREHPSGPGPGMSSTEPPTPSFPMAVGHAGMNAVPSVAAFNAAVGMPAEQVAKSRAEGVDPGAVGDILAAPQQGIEAVGEWGKEKLGGAAQTLNERLRHNQFTPEIDMNAGMDLRPVHERGIGPAVGEVGSLAAQALLLKAGEAVVAKAPGVVAKMPFGERLAPKAFDAANIDARALAERTPAPVNGARSGAPDIGTPAPVDPALAAPPRLPPVRAEARPIAPKPRAAPVRAGVRPVAMSLEELRAAPEPIAPSAETIPPVPETPAAAVEPAATPAGPASSTRVPEPAAPIEAPVVEPAKGAAVPTSSTQAPRGPGTATDAEIAAALKAGGRSPRGVARELGVNIKRVMEVRDVTRNGQEPLPAAQEAPGSTQPPTPPTARAEPTQPQAAGEATAPAPGKGLPLISPPGQVNVGIPLPSAADAAKAFDVVTAKTDTTWQRVSRPIADAVSKIADKVPGVKGIRQWGVNDALTLDPSEALFQGQMRRSGAIEQGQRVAEKWGKDLDKVTKDIGSRDAGEVYRYMGGERPDLPASARRSQATIDAAVADMHRTRAEMLARGLISEDVFKEYPRFVSRIMRTMAREKGNAFGGASGLPKLAEELYRQDAPGVIVGAPEAEMRVVAEPHAPKVVTGTKSQTLLKFETPEAREAFMADLAAWETAKRGKLTGPKGAEPLVVERFEALAADVREALGEITDPGDSFAMTIAKARTRIATADLLSQIKGMGKGQPGGDWVMPGPGSLGVRGAAGPSLRGYTKVQGKGWGALDGEMLRSDIHEYASALVEGKAQSAMAAGLKAAYSQWKFDRTVASLPTIMRNYLSSHYSSIEAGVNYANPRNWGYWKDSIKALTGRDPATLKWATENGVIGNDFYSAEFKGRVQRAMHGSENPIAAILEAFKEQPTREATLAANKRGAQAAGETVVNPLNAIPGAAKAKRGMGAAYAFENNSRRLAAALRLKSQGLSMPELMKELDRTTENYARQGQMQAALTDLPIVGPFARFTWEKYRIAKNNLVDHPVRLGETLLYGYAARKAVEAMFGRNVTDEEKEAVKKEFGWQTAALDPDKGDTRPRTWDSRYTFPLGNVMAGPETGRQVGEEGRAWVNYAAQVLGGGVAPAVDVTMALTTGKDARGKPVADSFTRDSLGPAGTGIEVWRQFVLPPIAGNQTDKFLAAKRDMPFSARQPKQSVEDVVLGYLTGVSLGRLDYGVARRNLGAMFDARKREVVGDGAKLVAEGSDRDEVVGRARGMIGTVEDALRKRKDTLDKAEGSRKMPFKSK